MSNNDDLSPDGYPRRKGQVMGKLIDLINAILREAWGSLLTAWLFWLFVSLSVTAAVSGGDWRYPIAIVFVMLLSARIDLMQARNSEQDRLCTALREYAVATNKRVDLIAQVQRVEVSSRIIELANAGDISHTDAQEMLEMLAKEPGPKKETVQ